MRTHSSVIQLRHFILSILILTFIFALLTQLVHAALVNYTTPAGNFRISYHDAAADYPNNCTAAEITSFGNILENLRNLYLTNYGLIAPALRPLPVEVIFQNINGHGWGSGLDFDPYWLGPRMLPLGAGGTNITIAPTATEATLMAAHELFHAVQCDSYGGTNPAWSAMKWIIEGQARMMQDKVSTALDQDNLDHFNYFGESAYYLGNPEKGLVSDNSYSACLFWNYLTEKYGQGTAYFQAEPQLGVDFITEFWNQAHAVSRVDGINTVNDALTALGHTATFEDVFRDFIVTNYVKDLTGAVPAKYTYADENQPPLHYDYDNNASTPAVKLDQDRSLGSKDTYSGSGSVAAWAARYYRIRPSTDAVVVNVQVTQTTSDQLSYHMLLIDGGNLVQEYRVKAEDFAKSVVNLDYDEIILIIGGLENAASNPATYNYNFSTGTASDVALSIESPLGTSAGARARVGSHLEPENFLSVLEVLFSGSPVAGLEKTDFTAQVGTATATIDTSGYVAGLYFLLVEAPNQGSAGLYDLQVGLNPVSFTGAQDSEAAAVEYNGLAADNMLVIDKSGSMALPPTTPPYSYGKISAAKLAAKLYVDSFLDMDKIGVIAFNETAWLTMNLQDITDTARTTAKNEIDKTNASGTTSIGGALLMAQNQLSSFGDTGHSPVIILLSDGQENTGPWVSSVRPNILGNGTTVHSIAIGADADQTLLRDLAYATPGGTFHYAEDPTSGDLPNDLTDIYRYIAEQVDNQKRVLSFRGTGGFWDTKIPIDKKAKEAVFVFSYNSSYPMKYGQVRLRDPNGTDVAPTFWNFAETPAGMMGYILWRVDEPMYGDWRMFGEGASQTSYLIETAIRHDLTMKLYFPKGEYARMAQTVIGEPVPILASLTQKGPVLGADVWAYITTPKGLEQPSKTHAVKLYDDGEHGDGAMDDGIYGNSYTRASRSGTYVVKAVATGNTELTGDFRREAKGAFYVKEDSDSDKDGLPDKWEESHGLDPNDPDGDNGAQGDPDRDGLSNIEEYEYGTHPFDSDTDRGGENDGSEVRAQRDPLDPSDDNIKPPTTISVVPSNRFNTVYLNLLETYYRILLYRSENETNMYSLIADFTPRQGIYVDEKVENDKTYYYRIIAVNEQGAASGFSSSASGTPAEDTEPPEGFLIINYGAESSFTQDVTLTLAASEDTVEMMVSNDPSFRDAQWESFTREKGWKLKPGAGVQTVWALFRDKAGNIGGGGGVGSSAAFDSIILGNIESCDTTGTKKDSFNVGEAVYVMGTGYTPSTIYNIYVVYDLDWTDKLAIPTRIPGTATQVSSDLSGNIPPTEAWSLPQTLGKYDIMVDVNNNGIYDQGIDALDDSDVQITAGLSVIPEYRLAALLGFTGLTTLEAFYLSKRRRSARYTT